MKKYSALAVMPVELAKKIEAAVYDPDNPLRVNFAWWSNGRKVVIDGTPTICVDINAITDDEINTFLTEHPEIIPVGKWDGTYQAGTTFDNETGEPDYSSVDVPLRTDLMLLFQPDELDMSGPGMPKVFRPTKPQMWHCWGMNRLL